MANNSFRSVGAGTTFLSPTDFIVEVDTSAGAVTLILPKIATILSTYVTIQQYIGIRFVDVSNNASVNNVTIAGFETDTINAESTITLDTNGAGGMVSLIGSGQWCFTQNSNGGAGITEYKKSLLPMQSIISQTIPRPELLGEAIDIPYSVGDTPFIKLDNGNLAQVTYCQSVLLNGIFIYEVYDIETTDPINGYWVAFKQNEQNPNLLEKVAELQMTSQFWNNWYDWTLKDSGDSVVKFIYSNYVNSDTTLIESFITTLTYANGTLTAVDTNFNFGGVDALTLYNNLSGYGIGSGVASWNYQRAEYILDDDYYGMANGTQVGWCYYKDNNASAGIGTQWDCVGFNVLTGETRWVTPVTDIVANVTNFNFTGVDTNKFIRTWFNHPNGITFSFSDNQIINNGDNVNGVTCIWSPYYQNPNEVIYIKSRDSATGNYIATGGDFNTLFPSSFWYWDNLNVYFVTQATSTSDGQCFVINKFNTNTKEFISSIIPNYVERDITSLSSWINNWANNDGMMFYVSDGMSAFSFGQFIYNYIKFEENLSLQSNNGYPTNMFGNKSYSTSSGLINTYNLGVEIDEFNNVQF